MVKRPRDSHALIDLPVGTVTFLFTDIEGSTQLLHQLRDQYADLLAEHHRLLREIFTQYDGREVDTQGDAFFIAFPRASDAVSAVVEAQRTLAHNAWPGEVTVRVRMGLHTGEPLQAVEGYVGADVHRAARIAHVGHGGQVLLSETAVALVRDDLPDGVELKDLGRHLLKDIHRPERIHQLVIAGLTNEFPHLTSLETLPSEQLRSPRQVGDCPYRGLFAFRERDAQFFFGRESFVDALEEAVTTRSMVAVIVGSSGSGKSSALFAGLVPRLRHKQGWRISKMRPGSRPFQALAGALTPLLSPALEESEHLRETAQLAQLLIHGEIDLALIVSRVLELQEGVRQVLLIIDQFEELYTLCQDKGERRSFIDALLNTVEVGDAQRDAPCVVLLTMRADFMGEALGYRPFAEMLQRGSLLMGPMTSEELKEAVARPAELQGAAFEPGLVDRLLDDVGEEPGNLPLLQFALTLLWEEQTDGWLTHESYESIGEVDGALSSYADEVFQDLTSDEHEQARRVFVQLVNPGEGTADTRRVARRQELGETQWRLVQHLASKRLVVTGRDAASGDETVEVVHEALIQRWGQLQAWMEGDRAFRVWQERLRAAMRQWQASEQDEGALLRGAPLVEAEQWLEERGNELSAAEQVYILESTHVRELREQERTQQRRRIMFGLAVGLVLAVLLAAAAATAWQRSAQNEKLAISRELAAAALDSVEDDPELGILLALEAVHTANTLEARNALHFTVPKKHLIRTIAAHERDVQSMDLSADGIWLATGGMDNTARVWDVASGSELLKIEWPLDSIQGVAFSPDRKRLITAGFITPVTIWALYTNAADERMTAEMLHILTDPPASNFDAFSQTAWSPDGKTVAAASNTAIIQLWNPDTGEKLFDLIGHEQTPDYFATNRYGVSDIAFSPDSELLVSTGTDVTVRVWDVAIGEQLHVFTDLRKDARAIAWSKDGRFLAVSGGDGVILVWDMISKGYPVVSEIDGDEAPSAVAFSPDGRRLAVGQASGAINVYDVASAQHLFSLFGHTADSQGLAFSPDGATLISVSNDATIRFWDTALDHELYTVPGNGAVFSPDGTYLATGSSDVTIWESETGQKVNSWPAHEGLVPAIRYSPDGTKLATVGFDGTEKIWDARTGEMLHDLTGSEQRIWDAVFSPDGGLLATGGLDSMIRIHNPETGELITSFVATDWFVNSLDFSPDGSMLSAGSIFKGEENQIKLWDTRTWELSSSLKPPFGVNRVDLSPDEVHLAASHVRGMISIWDLTADIGEPKMTIRGHSGAVNDVTYNAVGTQFVTTGTGGFAKIWNAETGEELLSLAHPEVVTRAVFSPDGKKLATSSFDNLVRVFTLDLNELIDLAELRVSRSLTDEECKRFLHVDTCPR